MTRKNLKHPKGGEVVELLGDRFMCLAGNSPEQIFYPTFVSRAWGPRGGRAQRRGDDGSPAFQEVQSAVRPGNRGGGSGAARNFKVGLGISKMMEDGLSRGGGIRGRGPLSGAATTDGQQGHGCGGRSPPQPEVNGI